MHRAPEGMPMHFTTRGAVVTGGAIIVVLSLAVVVERGMHTPLRHNPPAPRIEQESPSGSKLPVKQLLRKQIPCAQVFPAGRQAFKSVELVHVFKMGKGVVTNPAVVLATLVKSTWVVFCMVDIVTVVGCVELVALTRLRQTDPWPSHTPIELFCEQSVPLGC